jgi:hypothetical protein
MVVCLMRKNQLPISAARWQFHQHFMSSFCTKILSPKITNPNCKHIKGAQKTFYEKAARKILVKLTPGGSMGPGCILQFIFYEKSQNC